MRFSLISRIALVALASSASFAFACGKAENKAPQCPTCVTADAKGFTPKSITLAKGGPGSKQAVTFTRTSDETCAMDVVVPDLNIKEPLPLNKPVTLQIPTDQARTLTFQCGMAMYKSSIVVN